MCARCAIFSAAAVLALACVAAAAAAAATDELPVSFGGEFPSATARALGNAFTALGDDVTALLLNPAGLVTTGAAAFYAGYGGAEGEAKARDGGVAAAGRLRGTVFSAAASRTGLTGGAAAELYVAGAARTLLEGAAGSFLSVGAALRAGRLLLETDTGCPACGTLRRAQTVATADAGMMIRPLPFVSLAVAAENLFGRGFEIDAVQVPWERAVRYGACWLHENRFIVSWERSRAGGRTSDHFGFRVRTAFPLEIMAGMTDERVSGGLRWDGGAWRTSAVFGQQPGGGVYAGASIEFFIGRPERVYQ